MSNPIVLHVNYVEQGQSLDEMCRMAVKWGYDGIEFRRAHKDYPTDQAYVDAIAKSMAGTGLKTAIFGAPAPNLMTEDKAERDRGVDAAIAFYRVAAKRLPLAVCNTFAGVLRDPAGDAYDFGRNGSVMARPEQWEWAVAGFQALGDAAAELGLRLAFETHNNYLHDLAKPTRELVDRIARPSVGINLDYGNIALHPKGEPLSEAIAICGDRLYEVHFKNVLTLPIEEKRHWLMCGLADGCINHREYLAGLKKLDYRGPFVLEGPREGDRSWFAREDLRYFKALLDEVW